MLTAEEIQQPRTPGQLVAFVESVRARAMEDEELRKAGHLRQDYLKEFFDEVVPLSRIASQLYPADYIVCPILGNQGYDAEVCDSRGKFVEYVEITNPIDGKAEHLAGQQLKDRGFTDVRVGKPGDDLEAVMEILSKTASKKAMKDYRATTVVFNVSALPPFEGFEDRYEDQVTRIKSTLSSKGFRAKRVVVLLPSGQVVEI